MFKSLFLKFSSPEEPVDYSSVVTDMHSHLIPGIDDGVKTMEESIAMIRELQALGFKKLVTTPHIMSDHYKNTPEGIFDGLDKVKYELVKQNIPMEVSAAAEYYLDDGFVKRIGNEKLLTFGNSYLLFEISYINFPESLREVVFHLQVHGYKPILAHPERYPFWFGKFEEYRALHDTGLLFQINTNSISGYYGFEAKRTAEKLIDAGLVDLIGTDLHGMKHIKSLQRAQREKYLKKVLELNLLNRKL